MLAIMASTPEQNRAKAKRYAERHPELVAARLKEWREKNKEHRAEYRRQYNAAHREENIAAKREWNMKNKDHTKKYQQQYAEANRAAVNLRTAKRKAAKRAATVGKIDVALLLRDMICGICRDFIDFEYHIDHIIPLAKGGAHAQENLQVAHPACNIRKRDKMPNEIQKGPEGPWWSFSPG